MPADTVGDKERAGRKRLAIEPHIEFGVSFEAAATQEHRASASNGW